MIVRDEEAVVERALRSAFGFADYFVVVDTGSIDGTISRVRETLAGRPHKLVTSEWKGFAECRNDALILARQHGEYIAFLDADDYFVGNAKRVRAQLREARAWVCYAYQGWVRHAMTFAVHRDEPVRWSGDRHEFLVCADDTRSLAYRLLLDFSARYTHQGIRSRQTDTWSSDVDAIARDAKRIEAADTSTLSPRSIFYLARSLQAAGDLDAAMTAFSRRAAIRCGDEEERWYAELSATRILELQQPNQVLLMKKYADLILARPSRAEPYLDLARQLRLRGRFAEAETLALQCCEMSISDDWVQVDTASYSIHAWDEVAVNRFHTARFDEATKLWRLTQLFGAQSSSDRARISAAITDCIRQPKKSRQYSCPR